MCGIAGYKCNPKHANKAFEVFTRLMLEAQIRGRHASGLSWIGRSNRLKTHTQPKPVEELAQSKLWKDLASDAPAAVIGHARYSTSGDWHDNANNQPIATPKFSIVHNGLVSMAEKLKFEKTYGIRTVSGNDTELLLRSLETSRGNFAKAFERIYKVDPPIFACGVLDSEGRLTVVRDHIRPLWCFNIKKLGMTGFASTEDIIKRGVGGAYEYEAWELEPYEVRRLELDRSSRLETLSFAVPSELRWPRPSVKQPMMLNKPTPKEPVLDTPKHKQTDHRRNLRKSFKQYCVAAIASWEIDPNYPLMSYLFKRYELSKSQEYWACFLYGTFYHPGSVFYVMQEFPEFEKVDIARLRKWHTANWRKLCYNTDRKYEKGHFVEMFESYRDAVGGQTPTAQEDYFAALLTADNPVENFHNVTNALRKLWHFGRYSVYIYTECLARCMGMPIEADTIFLKESDSPRAGLCKVLGKDEWAKGSLDKEAWLYLEHEATKLMREIQKEYPALGMDHWFMESCLCAYKGFFRPTKGRYLPYYLDRMGHEISQMRELELTSGIEWNVLSQFRAESIIPEYLGELAEPPRTKVTKSMEHVLRDTGRMIGLWPIKQRGLIK